ncbi:MAG: hypothetical protein U1F57_00920 [bacterium]
MKPFKKLLLGVLSLGVMGFCLPAWATVDNTKCTVKDQEDTPGNPSNYSLRGRLENGYNLSSNRACTELIRFEPGASFNIQINGTLTVNRENDGDFDGDGNNLIIAKGDAGQVIIDGHSLSPDACVLDLVNPGKILIQGIEIHAKKLEKAICHKDNLKPGSTVIIVADDDKDHDGISDDQDNCPDTPNPDQSDVCHHNPPQPTCGDGTVQTGEDCEAGPCCDSTCHWKAENTTCDDGDSTTTNTQCNAEHQCVAAPHCGDHHVDSGEDCDGEACCDDTCHWKAENATCDDGSATTTGDKCDASHTCAGTPIPTVCGNGMKEGTEGCDDGNTTAGDGCSATCTVEPGFTCDSATPNHCTPTAATCGNGTKEGSEGCDDGNTTAGDGCSATCTVESGFTCDSATPNHCTATTGTNPGGNTNPPTGGNGSSGSDAGDSTTISFGDGGGTGGCSLASTGSGSISSLAWFVAILIPNAWARRSRKKS